MDSEKSAEIRRPVLGIFVKNSGNFSEFMPINDLQILGIEIINLRLESFIKIMAKMVDIKILRTFGQKY
jgi:hypothetical protein